MYIQSWISECTKRDKIKLKNSILSSLETLEVITSLSLGMLNSNQTNPKIREN